jgi:hypothetical protein
VTGNTNLATSCPTRSATFEEGKAVAQSWGNADELAALDAREKEFADAAAKSLTKQWQTNPAVHFNEWANFGKKDFAPVVAAFRKLF